MTQQGDVRLFQTVDGGEIESLLGVISMDGGLETAVYLSLFGGNEDDPGGDDTRASWWGNFSETGTDLQYRSETQNLLRSLPVTSANLRRIEDAAGRDLAWMVPAGAASDVKVSAAVQVLKTVQIAVTVQADGAETDFVFSENWKASA